MYNILKAIAETQVGAPAADQFGFTYARRDFQNLVEDLATGATHIFLDPVERLENFTEYNEVDTIQSSGQFMVVISSDIDKGDYELRYVEDIQPLLVGALATIKAAIKCNGSVVIDSWRTVEVINMFDYNVDGIAVTYQITENV